VRFRTAWHDLPIDDLVGAQHVTPESRAFYDRKRAEGKRHTQALVALARRRVNVWWEMLRDGTSFEDRSSA